MLVVAAGATPRWGEPNGLVVGSADPHCMWAPGQTAEPKMRSRATFGVGALEAARVGELRGRLLPTFNVAPPTSWRKPPVLAEGSPPVVRRLSDVVTTAALREVWWWTRKMGACLRAAARGNVRLAKQLRPPDLCLHEGHMVEGTERWVWDLRPLQEGRPAEPLQPSGEGRPPATDLNVEAVRAAGLGFADQAIISELVYGISDDNPGGMATVLSPPHEGALRFYAEALKKVMKDFDRGWSSGGWRLPFWPIRANAYSVVEEVRAAGVKHRMVVDLSWPRWGGEGGRPLSVHAASDRSEWPAVGMPRPMQIAESAAILLSSGGRVRLWGLDCEAYYRKVGRQNAEIYRNCIWMRGGFVVDPREQFGDASAAVKCVRMSGLLAKEVQRELRLVDEWYPPREEWVRAWLAARPADDGVRSRLAFFGMYVDDGAGGSIDDGLWWATDGSPVSGVGPDEKGGEGVWRGRQLRRAEMHYWHAIDAIRRMGHVSEPSKEQPPGVALGTLGVEISLRDRRARLMADKRARYSAEAMSVAELNACPLVRLEEITHKLLYAATVFPQGRQWLHCLFGALRARYRMRRRGMMPLSMRVRMALRSWAAELRRAGHEGVPLAARAEFPAVGEPGVMGTYSDASGEYGFGAWAWAGGRKVLYTCEQWGEAERPLHINLKELVGLAASTEAFVERWPQVSHVREFTDNTCAEWAAHGLSPRTAGMQRVMARRVAALVERSVYTDVARVATKENRWADWLSREGGEALFLRQAAQMGIEVERVAAASWWRDAMADDVE